MMLNDNRNDRNYLYQVAIRLYLLSKQIQISKKNRNASPNLGYGYDKSIKLSKQ